MPQRPNPNKFAGAVENSTGSCAWRIRCTPQCQLWSAGETLSTPFWFLHTWMCTYACKSMWTEQAMNDEFMEKLFGKIFHCPRGFIFSFVVFDLLYLLVLYLCYKSSFPLIDCITDLRHQLTILSRIGWPILTKNLACIVSHVTGIRCAVLRLDLTPARPHMLSISTVLCPFHIPEILVLLNLKGKITFSRQFLGYFCIFLWIMVQNFTANPMNAEMTCIFASTEF